MPSATGMPILFIAIALFPFYRYDNLCSELEVALYMLYSFGEEKEK
jgi:hypothetical protein